MVKKTVKKVKRIEKRDKGGRFKKGTGGGPGRKKGTIKDITCKDGKKRSVAVLVDDLLAAYAELGGDKFLLKWASQSHRNLAKFIDILFKFVPQPELVIQQEFKPLTVQIKQIPKGDHFEIMQKDIRELQDELREKNLELLRLRSIFDSHDIQYKEIEHEPIRNKELPSHKDDDDKEPGDSSRVN